MSNSCITAILAVTSLSFSAGAMAQSMSKSEYKAAEKNIKSEYKSAKADCDSFPANAKNICMAIAKSKEKAAKTELEARYKPYEMQDTKSALSKHSGLRSGQAQLKTSEANTIANEAALNV